MGLGLTAEGGELGGDGGGAGLIGHHPERGLAPLQLATEALSIVLGGEQAPVVESAKDPAADDPRPPGRSG